MNRTQMTGSTGSAGSKEELDSSLRTPAANKLSAGDPGRWNDGGGGKDERGGKDKKGKRLMDNFLSSYRKPFSVEILAEMTGVGKISAKRFIGQAMAAGEVREIERGIWLVKRRDTFVSTWDWRYSRSAAEALIEVLKAGAGGSIRKIAREMGFSRQYVFKYLEALASIGAVGWDGSRYISTGRGDMLQLGTEIEKGVLSRIKREAKR